MNDLDSHLRKVHYKVDEKEIQQNVMKAVNENIDRNYVDPGPFLPPECEQAVRCSASQVKSTPTRLKPIMVSCPKCPSDVRKCNLRRHLQRTHEMANEDIKQILMASKCPDFPEQKLSEIWTFMCPQCPATVKTATNLKRHLKKVHKVDENVQSKKPQKVSSSVAKGTKNCNKSNCEPVAMPARREQKS